MNTLRILRSQVGNGPCDLRGITHRAQSDVSLHQFEVHCVRELQSQGMPVFFTIDAGPQVKVVALPGHGDELKQTIATIPGVIEIIPSALGAGARIIDKF